MVKNETFIASVNPIKYKRLRQHKHPWINTILVCKTTFILWLLLVSQKKLKSENKNFKKELCHQTRKLHLSWQDKYLDLESYICWNTTQVHEHKRGYKILAIIHAISENRVTSVEEFVILKKISTRRIHLISIISTLILAF